AYKYFTSPSEKALPTDFHNHDFSKSIIIEAVFIKEALDDKSFSGKGLDKWVDGENHVKVRKVWVNPNEAAKKRNIRPSYSTICNWGIWWHRYYIDKRLP
ncbi:hypothetical protein ACXDBF_004002, partial [Cronobacter sakazakii]